MVKVGPAFFDYISSEKIKVRRNGNFIPQDLLSLLPIFVLVILFSIILARIFYLQVLRGDYYKNLSEQNRTWTETIPAPRGIIYDKKDRPLVSNSPSFNLSEKGKIKTVSKDEALMLISQGKKVEDDLKREYLYKDTFAHALGYLGQMSKDQILLPDFKEFEINDFVGKMGIEEEYEKLLHGTNGKKLYEVDSQGKKIRELGVKEPVPGQNLKTTLDLDIAISVKEAFKEVEKGAAVVSEPKTGAILTLYSKPSFDPNIFTHDETYNPAGDYESRESILTDSEKQPLLNRAIGGMYPPGSTFKLVTAIAALEKGVIKKDTQIEDTGILRAGSFSFGNWYFLQYGRKEGSINIVDAIKRSNDIFFYKAAERTGVDFVSLWAKTFGLGQKLTVDISGEEEGTVPSASWKEKEIGEKWYLGDTYNYGIGQGYLLTTPLQVNSFTNVFANGGKLMRPHLIKGKDKILKKDFIKKENLELVRLGMLESCETGGVAWPFFDFKVRNERLPIDNKDYIEDASGSAKMIRIKTACKTGTAESGGDNKPHAWITVFAPFYKPEIVVTVLVENGGEGSSVAGPIAKKILADYFERK